MDNIYFKSTINNKYNFLSNFYPYVKGSVNKKQSLNLHFKKYPNKVFPTSEHYYQYRKYLIIDPIYAETYIYTAITPQQVKKASGKGTYINLWWSKNKNLPKSKRGTKKEFINKFDIAISKFNENRINIMNEALYIKFSNEILKKALLNTNNCNLHEIGRFKSDFWAVTGKDMLGKLLMNLRQTLRSSK